MARRLVLLTKPSSKSEGDPFLAYGARAPRSSRDRAEINETVSTATQFT